MSAKNDKVNGKLEDGCSKDSKTSSEYAENSNSNSGSLFSRRYADDLQSLSVSNDSSDRGDKPDICPISRENDSDNGRISPSVDPTNVSFPKWTDDNSGNLPSAFKICDTKDNINLQFCILAGILTQTPRIKHRETIDLANEKEKENPDDIWFEKTFNKTLGERKEGLQQPVRKVSPIKFNSVQVNLRRQLVEKSQREQQKRRAVYEADNELVAIHEQPEIDADKDVVAREERGTSGSSSEEESEENVTKEEYTDGDDELARCDFIFDQADESDSEEDDVEETIPENDKFVKWMQSREREREEQRRKHGSCVSDDSPVLDESSRDSTSMREDLLEDAARNCSGFADFIFSSPRKYKKSTNTKVNKAEDSSDEKPREQLDGPVENGDSSGTNNPANNEDDPRASSLTDVDDDYNDDDEPLVSRKKPKKQRLLFSDDEDSRAECMEEGDTTITVVGQSSGTDGETDSRTTFSSNKEEIVAAGTDKLSVEKGEEIFIDDDINKRSQFDDENDKQDKDEVPPNDNEIQSAGNDDEEEQQNEVPEELNPSDDELEVFRRLLNAEKPRKKKKFEYIEDEASLSGDDTGSDENEEDDGPDEYEAEEGDKDDLPDDEIIWEQLRKQHMKLEHDDEVRELTYWQERFLKDGDLTSETDRTFRFKLRPSIHEHSDEKLDDTANDAENAGMDEEELEKRRREMFKWKKEAEKNGLYDENVPSQKTNLLLRTAVLAINKGSLASNNHSWNSLKPPTSRNSLLGHRRGLHKVLCQTDIRHFATAIVPSNNASTKEHNEVQNSAKRRRRQKVAERGSRKKLRRPE